MTLSNFYCERCQDRSAIRSAPKGFLDFVILPLFLIRHVRCVYCGDRCATFGLGKNRIVFSRSFSQFTRKSAMVLLCAAVVAGAIAYIFLR